MITLQQRIHGVAPPPSWSLGKLHRILRVRRNHKNLGMEEKNLLSLSYGHIIRRDIETAEGLLPESFETYQIVNPGNIVMRLTDLQNDKRSLRQGLVHERGIITSAYDALEVGPDHDPRFWAYALLALDLAKYYYSQGGGVRQSINFADFPNDWIAVPQRSAQKEIADFLDRETARINQLIEKKTLQTAKLDEEFRAFISLAVTGGIYKGRTRPSPHPWLPSIPEHWTVPRLKVLCSRIVDCLHETPEHSESGEYPSIRTADVERGRILIEDAKKVSETQYTHRIQRLEPAAGDIVYTREGERFGIAALVPDNTKLCLGQRMMMFRTNKSIRPAYLMWSLNGEFAYQFLKQSTAGATSPHLNIFDIRNVPIFLPPFKEQDAILSEIDLRSRKQWALSETIASSIERLREFRSALITATVTGEINIADWRTPGSTNYRTGAMEIGATPS
jgi:type I restriction enzyme, S subunit